MAENVPNLVKISVSPGNLKKDMFKATHSQTQHIKLLILEMKKWC